MKKFLIAFLVALSCCISASAIITRDGVTATISNCDVISYASMTARGPYNTVSLPTTIQQDYGQRHHDNAWLQSRLSNTVSQYTSTLSDTYTLWDNYRSPFNSMQGVASKSLFAENVNFNFRTKTVGWRLQSHSDWEGYAEHCNVEIYLYDSYTSGNIRCSVGSIESLSFRGC